MNINFQNFFKKIKSFIRKNPLLTSLFVLSTLFFLIQHYFDFSWDFAAYIINAKYFFYGGNYFEVYRAPMISLMLGPLLLLGNLAPYIYILFVASLFFYSTYKLSNALFEKYFYKFKIKRKTLNLLFYFFSLNIFVLGFGLVVGTELLALSFFQLFIAYFILNKNSGHFLALAFLSRYNFFVFVPFLFLNKSLKQILKNLGLFFLVTFPWFLFNKIKWGNWFTSIADAFHLNVFSRLDMAQPFDFSSLLIITNWFLPFVILGLSVPIMILLKSKNKKISNYKYEILFAAIFLLFLYDVYTIPFKIVRYLFNMALPVAFFSMLGAIVILKNLRKESWRKGFIIILSIGFLISLGVAGQRSFRMEDSDTMYIEAIQDIESLGLSECQILSPHWVPANYYSGNVRYFPYTIQEGLDRNEIMLIFYKDPTMDDKFTMDEIKNYNLLSEEKSYVIIANPETTSENCIKAKGYSNPMTSEACQALSNKFHSELMSNVFLRICRFVNYLSF